MTRSLNPGVSTRSAYVIGLGLLALVLLLACLTWGPLQPLSAQAGCSMNGTPYFTEYYGAVTADGQPAEIGTLIEAFNPQGVRTGCFVVNTPGFYGYMRVYGADPSTGTPGMVTNQAVTFKVNGVIATSSPATVLWTSDMTVHEVGLTVTSVVTPPIVTVDQNSIAVSEGQLAANAGTVSGSGVTLTATAGTVADLNNGHWSWSFSAVDGPANSQSVTVAATNAGGSGQASFNLTVINVAPSATFTNNGPVNEGSAFTLSLTNPVDPSPVDVASLTYAFDCGTGSGYGPFGASNTASCPTTDSGSRTVKGKVRDKDGGESEYTATVTVNNVAPTATFTNNGPVNEGTAFTLSLANPVEPSAVDAASLTYAFDCGAGSGYGPFGANNTASCPTADNGIRTVKGKVKDKDGGESEYTAAVTVHNVAPTATFTNNGPVNEGSSFTLALTNPIDPSPVDAASLTYAFDCGAGSGYGSFGTSNTATCPTTDNATRSVKGKVRDKDGSETEYTATVTATNVAPTATFGSNGPVCAGSSFVLSLTNPVDVAADLGSLQYAFDCGDGTSYGSWLSTSTRTCSTTTAGTRTVKGKVKDKDTGMSEYTASISVLSATSCGKTKSFQNGAAPNASYTGSIDAYVSEAQSTTNFGAAASLIVSGSDPAGTGKDKWALLKWNLSTITGIVQSASLTLNITDHSGGQTYELYEALATWSETTVKWSAKPAKGTALLGTVRAAATGSLAVSLNTAGVAVVQKWLNTPSKNYGFYLLHSANTDTMAFDSREKTTATLRPKLTVTYKPPVITSGPTVSALTATTATVVWETDTYAKSKIKYRKQGTTTWTTKTVTTKLISGKWVATASITALTANTTYEYQVQASADAAWTSTRTFKTLAASPAGGEEPAPPSAGLTAPSGYFMTLPAIVGAADAEQISLPVFLTLGSGDVSGLAFTLAMDPSQVSFDATDADEDGLPDAVSFHLPGGFTASVTWNPADGKLAIVLSDLNREALADLDGALLSISLTQGAAWQPGHAPMTFAIDSPQVLLDTAGNSYPVAVDNDPTSGLRPPRLYLPLVHD